MTRRAPALAAALLAAPLALAACGSSSGSANAVAVTATDSKCDVATTSLPSGKTEFKVSNKGGDVTEVYVYGEGDKIMGELENIGAGTTRNFTVDLGAGSYEVACKPGMKGDGIRTAITVSGTATTEAAISNTVSFSAHDFDYEGLNSLKVKKGDTVEFVMVNDAPDEEHEFEVLLPDGNALGEIGPTAPGKTGRVVLTFDKPGTYTYVCGVADHEEKGMKGTFTVTA